MSINTCAEVKLDGTTLVWASGVMTPKVDGQPMVITDVINSPCGGFKVNAAAFKTVGSHTITSVAATDDEPEETFTCCGGLKFDKRYFGYNDGVISWYTTPTNEGDKPADNNDDDDKGNENGNENGEDEDNIKNKPPEES